MILSSNKLKNRLILYTLFFFSLWFVSNCQAEKIYRVGVTNYPPYVISEDMAYHGISIDIWELLRNRLNLKYTFVPMGLNIYQNVVALHNGEIDILVGPVTANYERSLLAQFTHPYALNRIGMVVPVPKRSFLSILGSILIRIFSWTLLIGLIVVVIYAHFIWYFERNHVDMPKSYFYGIRHVFWSCILRKDITEVASTGPGRFAQFFWGSSSALFLSMIYAAMATAVHYDSTPEAFYQQPEDFKNKRIVALAGGVGYRYAKKAGFQVTAVNDITTGITMILNNQADGYADYYEASLYYLRQHKLSDKLMMSPYVLKTSILAFALPFGSPLVAPINTELNFLEEFNLISKICENYLNQADSAYCL